MAQRHIEGCVIDWRSVFHPKHDGVGVGQAGKETSVGMSEGNNRGTQELPGLVSKLKQKAKQRKNQPARLPYKGKVPR